MYLETYILKMVVDFFRMCFATNRTFELYVYYSAARMRPAHFLSRVIILGIGGDSTIKN
jgi:hypothetical protein